MIITVTLQLPNTDMSPTLVIPKESVPRGGLQLTFVALL